MQTWRRAFATSARRLGHNSAPTTSNGRPAFLRCTQILQESKKLENCSYADQEVRMHGFIRSVRKQKRIAFAEISDGSTIEPVQAILQPVQAAEYVFYLSSHHGFGGGFLTVPSSSAYRPVRPLRYPVFGKLARLARSKVMSFRQQT